MAVFVLALAALVPRPLVADPASDRFRLIIETDAGGDPDDEQSLVRFLLYANEWDIEGIIANRVEARAGENKNPARTGLGIVQRLLSAYGKCYANLVKHDSRYPSLEQLRSRTVAGYDDTAEGWRLIVTVLDSSDARPVWYSDWGTDSGGATNNLRRALDYVLRERGAEGYAKFKACLRLSSADAFGEHTARIEPPFALWVDTFRPELERKRWYHRFSALTATAGGFDLARDMLTGHGALGALYPTNTTHWQKEGDTMTFLYLVPNGLNHPDQPGWGGWAGRYGLNERFPGKQYFWANQVDEWRGSVHRENTLRRWAAHLQNDFKARLDWCVSDFGQANHPPRPAVDGPSVRTVVSGEKVTLDASASSDPDRDTLHFEWIPYAEAGAHQGLHLDLQNGSSAKAFFTAPTVTEDRSFHVVLAVTDDGSPPLTRYQRVIIVVAAHR